MKTQYYLMMQEPKDNLYYLKANVNGAFYTIKEFVGDVRKRHKGFMSLKAVEGAKQDFHVGILKVTDKGIVRI
jgi:hypothetical protein